MAEKLNIVQSTTEPDKNNIWLKDNELKKFGAKGWSTIGGGGVSLDSPQVSEPSGSELVPINDNGENKVITINNLLNKGKAVCAIILDERRENIVNYSEVYDAIESGNKYFIIRKEIDVDTASYTKEEYTILYLIFEQMPFREVKLKILQDNFLGTFAFSLFDGHSRSIELNGLMPRPMEGIPTLDTGATLEEVVNAYNKLVDKLTQSGLII